MHRKDRTNDHADTISITTAEQEAKFRKVMRERYGIALAPPDDTHEKPNREVRTHDAASAQV